VGKVVREIVATMGKKKGDAGYGFKDSKVGNVRRLVDTMRRMNVTDDDEFTTMLDRIDAAIASADPQTLRDDESERAKVAKDAGEILADMDAAGFGAAS
jgi:hypothetical protein